MDRLSAPRPYRLVGPDGQVRDSAVPGTLGGVRRPQGGNAGLYGRLDCPAALRALARTDPPYRGRRVFFADAGSAAAAGFRPCAVCLPADYRAWSRARIGAG